MFYFLKYKVNFVDIGKEVEGKVSCFYKKNTEKTVEDAVEKTKYDCEKKYKQVN